MKHHYTKEQMQTAVDEACNQVANSTHRPMCAELALEDGEAHNWIGEREARLHLAREMLERLPEPPPPVVDGKTPGEVNHDAVANGDYDTYKKWSELSERGKRDVERGASAVLAAFGGHKALALLADRVATIAYDPVRPLAFAEAVANHIDDLREDINHGEEVRLADLRAGQRGIEAAIARMEAVPNTELERVWSNAHRTRLMPCIEARNETALGLAFG